MQSTLNGNEKGKTLKEKAKEKTEEKVDRLPVGVTNASPQHMILNFVGPERPEPPRKVEKEKEEKEKERKEKEKAKELRDYGRNGLRKKRETMTTIGGRLKKTGGKTEKRGKKTLLRQNNQHLRQLLNRSIMRI